jgi:peptidoglycan-associated lipoprotein
MGARTLLVSPAVALIALAGCAHSTPAPKNAAQLARPGAVRAQQVARRVRAAGAATARPTGPGPVYFDFDSALLTEQDEKELQKDAVKLQREHRALAAKRYLARLGIDPKRMKTLSYGKENPKYPGHDEASWAKNRRDDIIVEGH